MGQMANFADWRVTEWSCAASQLLELLILKYFEPNSQLGSLHLLLLQIVG